MAKPTNDRIVDLAQQIIDPHVEPGPLDREDLREALCELLERRGAGSAEGKHP